MGWADPTYWAGHNHKRVGPDSAQKGLGWSRPNKTSLVVWAKTILARNKMNGPEPFWPKTKNINAGPSSAWPSNKDGGGIIPPPPSCMQNVIRYASRRKSYHHRQKTMRGEEGLPGAEGGVALLVGLLRWRCCGGGRWRWRTDGGSKQ